MTPDQPNGSVSADGPILLAAEDRKVREACAAVIRECMACIQRGRERGLIR